MHFFLCLYVPLFSCVSAFYFLSKTLFHLRCVLIFCYTLLICSFFPSVSSASSSSFVLLLTRTNSRHGIICHDQRGEGIRYYLIGKSIWQTTCNCLPSVLLTTEDVNARTNTTYIPANCEQNCPREIILVLYVNDGFMRLLIQRLTIPTTLSGTRNHSADFAGCSKLWHSTLKGSRCFRRITSPERKSPVVCLLLIQVLHVISSEMKVSLKFCIINVHKMLA